MGKRASRSRPTSSPPSSPGTTRSTCQEGGKKARRASQVADAKPEVNKSDAIRDYYKAHPKAKTSEVVEALGREGIKVSASLVTTVKSKHNKRRKAVRTVVAKGGVGIPEVKAALAFIKAMEHYGGEKGFGSCSGDQGDCVGRFRDSQHDCLVEPDRRRLGRIAAEGPIACKLPSRRIRLSFLLNFNGQPDGASIGNIEALQRTPCRSGAGCNGGQVGPVALEDRQRCGWKVAVHEVTSDKSFGYGTYRFTHSGSLKDLDPNIVLGIFTYLDDNNEIDFELGRWGQATEPKNAQFVVQPASAARMYRFATGEVSRLTLASPGRPAVFRGGTGREAEVRTLSLWPHGRSRVAEFRCRPMRNST